MSSPNPDPDENKPPSPGRNAGKPPTRANEFVRAVNAARQGSAQNTPIASTSEGEEAAGGGDSKYRKVLQFIGFLDAKLTNRPRRLYFTPLLDEGVDVDAIVHYAKLPISHKDGLQRDAIWVLDGDVTYWSKHPPKPREPKGGNGFPLDGPPFG